MDLTLILFIVAALFSLIGLIYNNDKKRIEDLENEMKEIKENYLSRFEALHQAVNAFKIETLKELSDIKILIEKSKK